jgi:signal transduction histidine kinase
MSVEEALLDRERRLRRQNEVLLTLARSPALADGDLDRALHEITEAAAANLSVARASVWRYQADRASLVCDDLFQSGTTSHQRDMQLFARDYPTYFQALEEERTITAHNALGDTRTKELADSYLRPLGITSMLDAPIRLQGKMIGVLCHEHVGTPRAWSVDEQNFAGSLADCVSLAIAAADRKSSERQLADQVAELARSNAELEQFASVASHDLQEPLRMVQSFVSLLQSRYQGRLDEDADLYISHAVEGVKRMRECISGLLAYSRAGRNDETSGPVDASRAAAAAVSNLGGLIAETGAEVVIGKLPVVHGGESRLTQVLQNLIENGLKYRREGVTPRVEVTAERRDRDWLFQVKDNGIGIEPRFFQRIFLLFQRLHDRGSYPGSGMGLSIAKRIVEHDGGRMWVESAVGIGSSFYFTAAPDRTATPPAAPA